MLPLGLQLPHTTWVPLIFAAESLVQSLLVVAALNEAILLPRGNCPADARPAACAVSYFWSAHMTTMCKWVICQAPARIIFFPELLRNGIYTLQSLAYVAAFQSDALTPSAVIGVALRAVFASGLTPLVVTLCQDRLFKQWHARERIETCPQALRPARDAACGACDRLADWLLPEPIIDFNTILGIEFGVMILCAGQSVLEVCHAINTVSLCAMALSLASKLRAGSSISLRLMERRLGLSLPDAAANSLQWRLSAAVSEHDVLRVASEALHALFPGACAQAVATLADTPERRVSFLEVAALSESDRRALQGALPRRAAVDGDDSVAFVCAAAAARGCVVAHSDDWQPAGVTAFSDWAAATDAGLQADQLVTARLTSGVVTVGFICLAFRARRASGGSGGIAAAPDGGFASSDAEAGDALRALAEAVGDAVLARRAKDAAESSAQMQTLARDIFPQHVLNALSTRANSRAGKAAHLQLAGPAAATSSYGTPESLLTDNHACVTCIFADVCGFTRIAGLIPPEEAMRLLDRLFQRFDSLATAHGVYKGKRVSACLRLRCALTRSHAALTRIRS